MGGREGGTELKGEEKVTDFVCCWQGLSLKNSGLGIVGVGEGKWGAVKSHQTWVVVQAGAGAGAGASVCKEVLGESPILSYWFLGRRRRQ